MRFVDTSYWVALLLGRDRNHTAALSLWQADPGALLCTNHVLGETWTFLRRRAGFEIAVSFIDAARSSQRLSFVHVDAATESEAWSWLERHGAREYSFVDATSFAVMRRGRIEEALAFDGDFSAAGFVEVRPS